MSTLKRREKSSKGYVSYSVGNLRGSVYIPVSMFVGDAPDTIEVSGVTFAEGNPATISKAKMTPEERTAQLKAAAEKRKNMTPAERAEAAKKTAERAAARAAKLEAAAAVPASA